MNRQQLFEQIKAKRSFLCVGLDTDIRKIPEHIRDGAKRDNVLDKPKVIFEFNKAIIDATARYAVAYKPNLAFYEASGGIGAFVRTCEYIKREYPDIFIIADAKRGDTGNTSAMYARAFFDGGSDITDAVTLSPYMGRDTVDPFLKYEDKWAIILALTSNKSADDFETLKLANGDPLWKEVLRKAKTWGCEPHTQSPDGEITDNLDKIMFVVGATRAEVLREVREIVPDHFLLVPGVGAQGGSLAEVARHGLNNRCGLLVNSSRGIIYASEQEPYGSDSRRTEPGFFTEAAAAEAKKMADEMAGLLDSYLKL